MFLVSDFQIIKENEHLKNVVVQKNLLINEAEIENETLHELSNSNRLIIDKLTKQVETLYLEKNNIAIHFQQSSLDLNEKLSEKDKEITKVKKEVKNEKQTNKQTKDKISELQTEIFDKNRHIQNLSQNSLDFW